MIPLASLVLFTALGILGAAAIITASPSLPGVITSATVLLITIGMGQTVAVLLSEALDDMQRRRPRHGKPGRVQAFIDGDAE